MKRESIKEFALITIGIFLVAISVVYFFEPNNWFSNCNKSLYTIYIYRTLSFNDGCYFIYSCINSIRSKVWS